MRTPASKCCAYHTSRSCVLARVGGAAAGLVALFYLDLRSAAPCII